MPAIGIGIGIGMSSMGGGFLPLHLPGAVAWSRSDQGITLNGSDVSQWSDLSGNGNHALQDVPSAQPTYFSSGGTNGRPYLDLAGAEHLFINDANSLDLATVTYVVILSNIAGGDHHIFVKGTAAVSYNYGVRKSGLNVVTLMSNSVEVAFQDLDTTGDIGISTGTMILGAQTATSQVSRVDANDQSGSTAQTLTQGAERVRVGVSATSPGPTFSNFLIARLYEIIVYNRVLTSAERAQLFGYAATRYGAA